MNLYSRPCAHPTTLNVDNNHLQAPRENKPQSSERNHQNAHTHILRNRNLQVHTRKYILRNSTHTRLRVLSKVSRTTGSIKRGPPERVGGASFALLCIRI